MEETGFPDIKNLIREEPSWRLKAFQRDSRKRTRVRAAKKDPFGLAFLPSTLYSVEALKLKIIHQKPFLFLVLELMN